MATRLPDGFSPDAKHRDLAATLGVDLDAELEKFRDHFLAARA
jgi:hypothetical protein